jgi:hypothetical protein
MKVSIIKRVILTIAAAALFVVPVSIISLQSNSPKTAEAYSPYTHNKYSQKDCFLGRRYDPAKDTCVLDSDYKGYENYSKTNSNCYYNSNNSIYTTCPAYTSTNYNTVNTSYGNNCASGYITYNCTNKAGYTGSNYSYSSDYSYYNYNSDYYATEPYVDIYVNQPNYTNYKLKNSDSQEFKNSYCQHKYNSSEYVFHNWYCVK